MSEFAPPFPPNSSVVKGGQQNILKKSLNLVNLQCP